VKPAGIGANATTVNEEVLTAVPPGVTTLTVPLVAPAGTDAVIEVELTTLNDVTDVPLNFTAVAPVKFVPVIVTVVPTGPDVGVKEEMVGEGSVTV
jgi:hypothetical protein